MIRKVERADGARFQVYAQKGGKTVYVSSHTSKREAQNAEEDHRVTQRKIASGEIAPEVDTKRTLKAATDAWLASLKAGQSRSHRAYSEFVQYQIVPLLGDVLIATLGKKHVTKWRDDLATKYAPRTINSALGCLSSACSFFVDQQWIAANPCTGVAQAQVPLKAYNWIKTRPELERLLLTCPDDLRDMIAISVGTGLRIDELLHLHHDDCSLETRLITVQRGKQGPPKSGKIRHVPILDSVLPVFRQRALRRSGSMLLFPGAKGQVRAQTPVTTAFKSALRRAGMDTTMNWHCLRHTAASWWVMSGGDIFRLSKLLGHSSVKITQDTYAHLAPEAWSQDYSRVAFHVPSETAKVYEFKRGEDGKMLGKTARLLDSPDTAPDRSLKIA